MVKENISLTQLFMLIFNYLLGSAIVIGVGKDAKQDAWIAIILMTLIGIGLMYFYYSINRLLPNKNLFEIIGVLFYKTNHHFAKLRLCHLFSLYDNPGDSYLWRNDYFSHSSKYTDRGHHFFYYARNRLHSLPWFRGSRKSSGNIYSLYCAIFNSSFDLFTYKWRDTIA